MSSERLSDSDSENDEYVRSQSLSCVAQGQKEAVKMILALHDWVFSMQGHANTACWPRIQGTTQPGSRHQL